MTFIEKIGKQQQEKKTMVCVGLDTELDLLPQANWGLNPVLEFNKAIIDSTHSFVCAYKFNIAFYSANFLAPIWPQEDDNLRKSIGYIHEQYPEIPVILDSKRGDIANSAAKYVREAFEKFEADAVTVNPYLGQDALQPFLDRKDKGIIILCRTSNPGAEVIQNRRVKTGIFKTLPLYQYIARLAVKEWNGNGNCLLVVGATYPEELREVRKIVGNLLILVPGTGEQGGVLEKVVKNGLDKEGQGLIITASRSIIYASKKKNFAEIAGEQAEKLRDQINKIKDPKSR